LRVECVFLDEEDAGTAKTAIYYGDANDTFTQAIDDLRSTWQAHRARFMREFEQ